MPSFTLPDLVTRLSPALTTVRPRDVARIGLLAVDPRGRCNRHAMTVMTVAFLLIQVSVMALANLIGGGAGETLFHVINTPLMLIGLVALVKRLHDIGLSGFWAPIAAAFWIMGAFAATLAITLIVGPDHMATVVADKGALYWLVFAFIAVPAFGGFIWLHTTPGTTGSNRFGPVPGNDGFGPGHRRDSVATSMSQAVAAS